MAPLKKRNLVSHVQSASHEVFHMSRKVAEIQPVHIARSKFEAVERACDKFCSVSDGKIVVLAPRLLHWRWG